jgi:PhnB protein
MMQIQPYLFFNGRCEEAAEFYRDALGAEVTMMMRFSEMPAGEGNSGDGCGMPPADGDKIMHMALRIGETEVFASDGMSSGQPVFEGFSLSLSVPNAAEAERVFAVLSDGGQIQMPLMPSFFSPSFGMVADRFGMSWMVIAATSEVAVA